MSATMTKVLTDRINRIEVSATMAITAEALKMKAAGIDLANFGAGEPHFDTPQHIKEAAIEAIEKNFSRYTAVPGIPEVRKAVVERHAADFGSSYAVEECVFTTGGKLALFNAIQVLVDHGDEVVLPVPYWVSFKDIIEYAGGKVVFVESDEREDFRITAKMIEAAITPKTKAIILNTPSNPSGAVVSAADLEAIVRLAHARGIYLLLDECYAYLTYAGKPVSGGTFIGLQGACGHSGFAVEDLRDDGLAGGICAGAEADYFGDEQAAVAEHVERDQLCAEGGGCRADRPAAVRGRDAGRLPEAARPDSGWAEDDPRAELLGAAGRVLCVSQCERVLRQGRPEDSVGRGREAVERRARGGGSGRGLRDERPHPALVRGLCRGGGRGREADARVLRPVELGVPSQALAGARVGTGPHIAGRRSIFPLT